MPSAIGVFWTGTPAAWPGTSDARTKQIESDHELKNTACDLCTNSSVQSEFEFRQALETEVVGFGYQSGDRLGLQLLGEMRGGNAGTPSPIASAFPLTSICQRRAEFRE